MIHSNTKPTGTVLHACQLLEKIGLGGAAYEKFIQDHFDDISVAYYEKDEIVFSKLKFQKALAVVTKGVLVSRKKVNGGELSLREIREGDIFGVAGLFGMEGTYVSEIVSREHTVVVYFSESFLEKLFLAYPEYALSYIKLLSKKIRYLNSKLDGFASPNAYSKVSLFLYENRGYTGSMSTLADTLGMSRMTLYRAIDALISEGRIEKNRRQIVLKNLNVASLSDANDEIL